MDHKDTALFDLLWSYLSFLFRLWGVHVIDCFCVTAGALQCQTCTDPQCSSTFLQTCSSETFCITATILGNLLLFLEKPLLPHFNRLPWTWTNCTLTLQTIHLEAQHSEPTRPVHRPLCVQLQPLRHSLQIWVLWEQFHLQSAATQTTATQRLCPVRKRGWASYSGWYGWKMWCDIIKCCCVVLQPLLLRQITASSVTPVTPTPLSAPSLYSVREWRTAAFKQHVSDINVFLWSSFIYSWHTVFICFTADHTQTFCCVMTVVINVLLHV